ncbi:hypothetical protein [Lewinella sp. IMCC34183]|uniref:hypothetical protein n=1 Tax=Lewinella sp. IMCC34183 TaxID=2248762 RepID=UPI000E288FFD|nr:hypothetical protein [Lewinella sp. IMCC34183]
MKRFLPFTLCLWLLAACEKDNLRADRDCGPDIVFLQDREEFPDGDDFHLLDVAASGTCLSVKVGASGCSSDGWSMDIYTDGFAGRSLPPSTLAGLVFNDGVPDGAASCEAYFTVTYAFDLSDYLTQDLLPTNLTLYGTGADTTLYIE